MIVVVARDEGLRLRVAAALRGTRWDTAINGVGSVGEAQQLLESSAVPSAVVVGPAMGLSGATDLVRAAAGLRTPPPVLLVATPSTDVLRAAMRAGVRDVLPPEFEADDIVRAFEDAGIRAGGPPSIPGLTVAVFSTKGGVGTSVVASNLAVRLAAKTGHATTLIDLDLASADQAIMSGITPRWTLQDLAEGAVGLDPESLRQALVDVAGSGSRLLPGPIDPALAETITGTHVASVISAARAESPVAVLDTAASFDDRTLAALDAADCIVVVSSLDVAALRALTVSLQTLERLGIPRERLVVAVSRADSKSGLTIGDVERAIDRQVDVGIPSTRSVPKSVNEGVPLAVSSPRSPVISAIDQMVDIALSHAPAELAEATDDEGRSSGLFPWSRSRGASSTSERADRAEASTDVLEKDSDTEGRPPTRSEGPRLDGGESPVSADVLSLHERLTGPDPDQRRPVRRRVVRPVDDDASDEVTDEDSDAALDERPSLEAMPPPILIDDENDQPRHRRGRR